MTTDLTTAERELAEALCHEPDWRLPIIADGAEFWVPLAYRPLIRFVVTYELARRERERRLPNDDITI